MAERFVQAPLGAKYLLAQGGAQAEPWVWGPIPIPHPLPARGERAGVRGMSRENENKIPVSPCITV